MKKILMALAVITMLASCSHHTYVVGNGGGSKDKNPVGFGYSKNDRSESTVPAKVGVKPTGNIESGKVNFLPNATAFRMSGNYANNVAVTLGPDGELTYFPAPSDITADSEPIELGEGWWLNNQGLGPNSVFTKYTFAEYAALPEAPSPEQIKLNIIHGAKVTDFMELPMKIGEANQNLEAVKEYVKQK